MRRNNRPEGEFFLFSAPRRGPLPPVRLSRQKYAKPCAPTVEKLGRLIGQSPNLTWVRAGHPASVAICEKKEKEGKAEEEKEKKYESLLAGTRGAYEWMTVRE